jgi:hypothetical protein
MPHIRFVHGLAYNGDPSGPESHIVQKMGGKEGRIDASKPQGQETCVNKQGKSPSDRYAVEGGKRYRSTQCDEAAKVERKEGGLRPWGRFISAYVSMRY